MVDSREAVTPKGKRVVIAGIHMMCQSVKTDRWSRNSLVFLVMELVNFLENIT